MSATVVYEIALYQGQEADSADPILLERRQLIAKNGVLQLHDGQGNDILCKETDAAAAIRLNPALRTVLAHQQARITCGEDILGQLPMLLERIPDSASLFVNGKGWDAFPTLDGEYVMLPGNCGYDFKPEMNPCWAEYSCSQGGRHYESQLNGYSSIGLLAPGVVIEHGRTDYGGNGGKAAVSIAPFDDFAATFIDWLFRPAVLDDLWSGDSFISTPDLDLFNEAAAAEDHVGSWDNSDASDEPKDDEDDDEEDDDDEDDDEEEDDDDCWGDESCASRYLELHLPQELIDEVRTRFEPNANRTNPA